MATRLDLQHGRDGVIGVLARAACCCRSFVGLFLLLTLASALYECAVEKYAFIPGVTVSASDAKSSLEVKFLSRASHKDSLPVERLNASKVGKVRAENRPSFSHFSSFLGFSGRNRRNISRAQKYTVSEGIEDASSDVTDHAVSADTSSNNDPNLLDAGSEVNNGMSQGQAHQAHGAVHEDLTAVRSMIERSSAGEKERHMEVPLEVETRIEAAADTHQNHVLVETPLPSLKLHYVGNKTKNDGETMLEADESLGFSSPRLLGRRRFDRRAPPHMGLTVLLMLLILIGVLVVILGVIAFQHAAVLGAISYSVVSAYLGKRTSVRKALKAGFKAGFKRLVWLAILYGTIRGFQCLFLLKTVFRGVLEMDQMESLILRLSLMPFSVLAPFRDKAAVNWEMASRIGIFLVLDYIFLGIANAVYIVACWVTIMEPENRGRSAIRRSWKLVKSMHLQVITIKLLEGFLCGRSCRWVLQQFLGSFLSALLISAVHIYFTVVWLVLYFSARYKQDGSLSFSHAVLEDFLDRHK